MNTSEVIDIKYDPKLFEQDIYNREQNVFTPELDSPSSHNYFSILMPPPNITGNLHLGHALTYTLQDLLVRYHRNQGASVYWQPGVDHAGIATQLVVEKWLNQQGIDPNTLSHDEFIRKVWDWKQTSANNIQTQQKALGCSAPWEYSRFTMDPGFCQAVVEAFNSLFDAGLIFKDQRLVNWDTKLETAISDLEIKNVEARGTLWYINYQIKDSAKTITIATTRPETMFGDQAIAVNPNDPRYQAVIGQYVVIPLTNKAIPIIADEYADMTKGSGCVKITPAHDFNDFQVGKRHNLEPITILDPRGHLLHSDLIPSFLQGTYVKKARKLLIDKLKEEEILIKEESMIHMVPYGDRSGTVIEPRITTQWFLNVKDLASEAISRVHKGEVKFYPQKWENTFFDWMTNIQPWCISRQIKWGHRIPAWYGPNNELIVAKSEKEAQEKAASLGINPHDLRPETDVLDTWFSSALWPFVSMQQPNGNTQLLDKFFPTSTLITGFDIIFFWVARMIMMSLYFKKSVPFRDVYIHALVRDEHGQKMSKSKGNVIDPMELMNEFGTDALRFTLVYLSVPGRDIKLSRDLVKTSRNFITKIWNAGRFLQTQEVNFATPPVELSHPIHHWIIDKLQQLVSGITSDIKEYRFDYIAHRLQVFLRDQFCDFFIEAMKFQNDEQTKSIAGFAYRTFLIAANPVIPFVTKHLLTQCVGYPETSMTNIQFPTVSPSEVSKVDDLIAWIHNLRSIKHDKGGESQEFKVQRADISSIAPELSHLTAMVR